MNEQKLVTVGWVVGAFGIHGWLKVAPTGENTDNFAGLDRIYLAEPQGKPQPFDLLEFRPHSKSVLLQLAGIENREQAQAYRGNMVMVEAETLAELEYDEYYEFQLVGLKVIDEDGEELGRVKEIISAMGNDVLVVVGDEELLLPFCREVVKGIEEERIVVRLMEEWER